MRGKSTNISDDGWEYHKASPQLRLPSTSMVEEFKTVKARITMGLKDSSEQIVRKAGAHTKSEHKWRANYVVLVC